MDALEAMQLFLGSARPAAAPAQEELTAAPPNAPPANSEAPLAALLCVSESCLGASTLEDGLDRKLRELRAVQSDPRSCIATRSASSSLLTTM